MSSRRRNFLEVFSLFCCSLILFTWGLSSEEIIGFESRFYLFALEMWRHGASWFPMTYHQPYPDYPATSTFLIYLSANVLGGMNKLAAVFPGAIAAAATISITYLIGALHNKRWGFYAVLFLLLTITFLKSARSLSLDIYPTMTTTGCFYLIYSADVKNKPYRSWWIYPLLLVSFAFRGPIGLVIPTGVICTYYLLDRNYKTLFISIFFSSLLLLVSTVLLLAAAYHVNGDTFMKDVLRMEVMGRMESSSQSVYFYFTNSMKDYALSFPIAFLALLGVSYYGIKTKKYTTETKFILKLLGWMIVILIGMSIPGDKKVRYILPMTPAAALISAYLFMSPPNEKYFSYVRGILIKIFLFFPAILALATQALFYFPKDSVLSRDIQYFYIFIFLIVLQLVSFRIFYRYNNQVTAREIRIFFIAAASFVFTYIAMIEPMELYIDRARDFVAAVETQRLQQHARLIFYKEKPDGLPIKYLINLPQEEQPIFIDNQQNLIKFSGPAFFVTRESYFAELSGAISSKYEIIGNDALGHKRVVVFKNRVKKT